MNYSNLISLSLYRLYLHIGGFRQKCCEGGALIHPSKSLARSLYNTAEKKQNKC